MKGKSVNDSHTSRWVYLVGSTQARPVKIGVAKDAEARTAELQTGSPLPLHLIWKTRGGRSLERALHERFAPYRTHGEWFDFGDESPAAIVASAAVLLGYVAYAERSPEGRGDDAPRATFLTGRKMLIHHLIGAASSTGRDNVTKQELFAYMATVDPTYAQRAGEDSKRYWSRAGTLLAGAMVKERLDVKVAQLTIVDGRPRVRGFRLCDLHQALADLLEGNPSRPKR